MKESNTPREIISFYLDELAGEVSMSEIMYSKALPEEQFIGQISSCTADDIGNLAKRAGIDATSQVLDIGCGRAGPACYLANKLGCKVSGIDLVPEHIGFAKKMVQSSKLENLVTLLTGDVLANTFRAEKFDVIAGIGSWRHFASDKIIPYCYENLVPGGRVAFIERVLLSPVDSGAIQELSEKRACTTLESFASYYFGLQKNGFVNVFIDDVTVQYLAFTKTMLNSVNGYDKQIIRNFGEQKFRDRIDLLEAEYRAIADGSLGLGLFVAEK